MLKLRMSDGTQSVLAMELEYVHQLTVDLPPGTKVRACSRASTCLLF